MMSLPRYLIHCEYVLIKLKYAYKRILYEYYYKYMALLYIIYYIYISIFNINYVKLLSYVQLSSFKTLIAKRKIPDIFIINREKQYF